MKASDYLEELKKKFAEFSIRHDDFTCGVNQKYNDTRDWKGLEQLHEDVLSEFMSVEEYELIRIKDIKPFEDGVIKCFVQAKEKLVSDPAIKVLYFEYFYDGAEWCTGNLYLCKKYKDEAVDWAAYFEDEIEGPSVHKYLKYDPECEFEELKEIIPRDYVQAYFLAACGRAWEQSGIVSIPFAFAEHDGEIVYLQNNT